MEILFKTKSLGKECNNQRLLERRHGKRRAQLIRRRLDELCAAETLDVLRALPQARCHELGGNRAGQLSVDLDGPYRLIFVPGDNPMPRKADGGLDWQGVTTIIVVEVENTHG
ncbi:MAG: killer suppression protein [Chloroflexaceae bacterium]|nr:killer suppression protein [Chloroflexaceae bacterium]NJL33473.1 killer suppression protein [Chloroflexaceae bacterium]NJO05650.1 killer suppression protein [Chloroflexaceae bacterium]